MVYVTRDRSGPLGAGPTGWLIRWFGVFAVVAFGFGGLLIFAESAEAQLACHYCVYDDQEDQHIFLLFVNCSGHEGIATANSEDGCRVCILIPPFTAAEDSCGDGTQWMLRPCPAFTCGPESISAREVASIAQAIDDSNMEELRRAHERHKEFMAYDATTRSVALFRCDDASVTHVPASSAVAAFFTGAEVSP
jgi:hypothetical protein